ncbi:alpha/beta hydrolase family protein [Rhodoferax saidenbachensis]|uniref:Dienelactone hydrolase n=2 Tax=Rhodoferax saidenbachensis TaxID=1484693 RepID=A0A1P8KFP6_9BURK|nr:dienelactone hydrolase [Rhodoferax saidenbachensis]APW44884.1 dienelactone hydrolase [Rhodoferax saidenbachensis]
MRRLQLPAIATLCLWACQSWAGMGLTELPAMDTEGPVTLMYPSAAAHQTVQRGPYTLQAAPDAAPQRGNGRLIVLSHGSGGAPWVHTALARHLVEAGYTVAFPEHVGDNWHDTRNVGPVSWQRRPLEVSHAIDAVAQDPRFAPLLDFTQVGMWGMSAGGHTALTLAGGRWSSAQLLAHCETHLADDFATCTGGITRLDGGLLDGLKKAIARVLIRWHLRDTQWHQHTDPRIRAVVAGVPFAVDFDLASLTQPVVPLGLIQAQSDAWLLPTFHSGPVIAACRSCETLADLPRAGHGALLEPLPVNPPGWLVPLLADAPDFDRATTLADLYPRVSAFFDRHLLATAAKP